MASIPEFACFEQCEAWPLVAGEDQQALSKSLIANGMTEAIEICTDPRDGVKRIVDGRNRYREYCAAVAAGLIDPDKHPLQVVDLGDLSLGEITDRILMKNRARRTMMEKGQMACTAITMWQNDKDLPKRLKDEQGYKGGTYSVLEQYFNVNHDYLYKCHSLLKKSKDIFDKVSSGELDVMAAFKKHSARHKLADAETNGDSGGSDAPARPGNGMAEQPEEKEAPVGSVKDADDAVYEKDDGFYFKVFQSISSFKVISKDVDHLIELVANLADQPGGKHLDREFLADALDGLKKHIKEARPHTPCPVCHGEGMIDQGEGKRRKECPACAGEKFLSYKLAAILRKASEKQETNGKAKKPKKGKKEDVKEEPAAAE